METAWSETRPTGGVVCVRVTVGGCPSSCTNLSSTFWQTPFNRRLKKLLSFLLFVYNSEAGDCSRRPPNLQRRDSDSRYRRNGLVPTTSMKEKDVQRNRPDHAEWDTADLQSFFFLPFFLGKNCYYSTIFLSSSREGFPWEKLGEIVFPCICVFFYSLCVCEKGGKRWILDHFFGWPHTVQTCAAGYLSSQHTLGKTYAVNLVGLSVHQNEINAPLSCLRRLLPH